jgi:hypothetical protein
LGERRSQGEADAKNRKTEKESDGAHDAGSGSGEGVRQRSGQQTDALTENGAKSGQEEHS